MTETTTESSPGDDGGAAPARSDSIVLKVQDLVVEFPAGPGERVHAVSGVSFDLAEGETLGLVGESGCGKTTTGRAIMSLPPPTSGTVEFDGEVLTALPSSELRRARRGLQIIFQDPVSSLNPRRLVEDIVAEPLAIWRPELSKQEVEDSVVAILEAVGIDPETRGRRPHEFSGGQCQRVAIARALMLDPAVLICDEPVSSLDVSVQAQIIGLLRDMKERYGLAMVFISHDLAVVRNLANRIAVMYLGRICELGDADAIYDHPTHPYTKGLLDSIPRAEARDSKASGPAILGELPSPIHPPSGCRFRTRCPRADDQCVHERPELRVVGDDHLVACHHPLL